MFQPRPRLPTTYEGPTGILHISHGCVRDPRPGYPPYLPCYRLKLSADRTIMVPAGLPSYRTLKNAMVHGEGWVRKHYGFCEIDQKVVSK